MVTAAVPKQRVLVVDDEPVLGRAITRMLGSCEVVTTPGVSAAVELLATFSPDLLIVDFYLPDGTGREVISALRKTGSRAPVLLMSGSLDLSAWAEWGVSLADDFLQKPFETQELRHKAGRLLDAFAREQNAERQRAELLVLQEAAAREAEAARVLLERMVKRGQFDPAFVRVESIGAGTFSGDVVYGSAMPDGRYRWMVGDVTGHTLASALVTIPVSLIFYACVRRDVPLVEMTRTLDRELASMLPVSMFFATTACELDRERGTLSVLNAGCPDVLIRHADGQITCLPSLQPPLGILRGSTPAETTIQRVTPGDRIYAFTDGLVEHASEDGTLFGLQRVRELLANGPADQAFARLATSWREHAPKLADDLSVVEVIV